MYWSTKNRWSVPYLVRRGSELTRGRNTTWCGQSYSVFNFSYSVPGTEVPFSRELRKSLVVSCHMLVSDRTVVVFVHGPSSVVVEERRGRSVEIKKCREKGVLRPIPES